MKFLNNKKVMKFRFSLFHLSRFLNSNLMVCDYRERHVQINRKCEVILSIVTTLQNFHLIHRLEKEEVCSYCR